MSAINIAIPRITPGCENFVPAMVTSSVIEIVLIVTILVLFIVIIVYVYQSKELDKEKKKKYIGGLIIGGTVFTALTAIVGIWQIMSAMKMKKCMIGG